MLAVVREPFAGPESQSKFHLATKFHVDLSKILMIKNYLGILKHSKYLKVPIFFPDWVFGFLFGDFRSELE